AYERRIAGPFAGPGKRAARLGIPPPAGTAGDFHLFVGLDLTAYGRTVQACAARSNLRRRAPPPQARGRSASSRGDVKTRATSVHSPVPWLCHGFAAGHGRE